MDKILRYDQLNNKQLAQLYDIAKRENVLDAVAFDVAADLDLFLASVRLMTFFGAGYDSKDQPLGFFYLTNFEGSTARLHFCFFEAGRDRRLELGRWVLDWCFKAFEFKCLIGIVPVINRGAVNYARALGGYEMGIIPGICYIHRLERSVGGVQFIFDNRMIATNPSYPGKPEHSKDVTLHEALQ